MKNNVFHNEKKVKFILFDRLVFCRERTQKKYRENGKKTRKKVVEQRESEGKNVLGFCFVS